MGTISNNKPETYLSYEINFEEVVGYDLTKEIETLDDLKELTLAVMNSRKLPNDGTYLLICSDTISKKIYLLHKGFINSIIEDKPSMEEAFKLLKAQIVDFYNIAPTRADSLKYCIGITEYLHFRNELKDGEVEVDIDVISEEVEGESAVEQPSHYNVYKDIEAFDIIKVVLDNIPLSAVDGYVLGNILKYRLRAGKKDDVLQDLAKADKYREMGESNE